MARFLNSGGIRAYRRYMPFFLGLILSDFVIGSTWNILSIYSEQTNLYLLLFSYYYLVIIRPGRDWELLDQNVTC